MADDELDDAVYEQIERLSQQGNRALEAQDYDGAVKAFSAAYGLLPEPKAIWDAALWLKASLGDAYFEQKQYDRALSHFLDARGSATGAGNPFVALRLGECYFELGRGEEAKRFLLQAHMLEGDEIFEEEDPKYLAAIRGELQRGALK